ncbi:hypothetical protein CJU60_13910 [Bacillus sp. 7705b]|nr:hypothetical protein CJU60_13910 [Bacillus sp. 7705b]
MKRLIYFSILSPPVLYRYSSLFFSLYRSYPPHTIKGSGRLYYLFKGALPVCIKTSKPQLILQLCYTL